MRAKKPTAAGSGTAPAKKPRRAGVPQAHGGVLVPGAGGGPQPGAGRKPSAIRELCRVEFARRIPLLAKLADGVPVETVLKTGNKLKDVTRSSASADVGERIRAMETLAKYGLGTVKEVSVENVRERVKDTLGVIARHTSPDQHDAICAELRDVWA